MPLKPANFSSVEQAVPTLNSNCKKMADALQNAIPKMTEAIQALTKLSASIEAIKSKIPKGKIMIDD